MLSASKDDLEMVILLVENGKAKIEKPDKYKRTALIHAVMNGSTKVRLLKQIVQHLQVNIPDFIHEQYCGLTAVFYFLIQVASYLLARGANPNQVDTSKNSCLHYACAYGWYHTTNLLIHAGAAPLDRSNEWGLTPLAIAMLKGNVGLAKYLLTLPEVDINGKDENGRNIRNKKENEV